jgi:hypothetical protein
MRMNYKTANYFYFQTTSIKSVLHVFVGDSYPSLRKLNSVRIPLLSRLLALCLVVGLGALSGATPASATTYGELTLSPSVLNFGSVGVGSNKSIQVLIKNIGTAPATISKEVINGTGFSFSGLTLPRTLNAGTSMVVTVEFKPTAVGGKSGYMELTSNARNATIRIYFGGTGIASTALAVPASASFGNVATGTTDTQSIQVQNHGTSAFTITKATISGTEFRISNLTTPHTVAAGQSSTFNVEFSPTKTGVSTGTIVLDASNAAQNISIALSGTGTAVTKTITASPTSVSFSHDAVGTHQTLTVTLKNTGNSSVTVSGISVSDPQLGTSGGVSGATLAAGQSATLNVIYSPTKAGNFSGDVKITSNASDSSLTVAATGSAFTPTTDHTVALKWDASASSGVKGYYLYRSTSSSTGFARLNSSYVSGLSYTDNAVTNGATYYYAVTAVSSSGAESPKSSEAEVTVP